MLKCSLAAIAGAIGKDETAACRIRSNERPCTLSEYDALLRLANLKLVDASKQCISLDELTMLRRTYVRVTANEEAAKLLYEDPE